MRVKLIVLLLTVLLSVTVCAQKLNWNKSCAISHVKNRENKIAITFDDGPHRKHTEEILDILKEYNVKATFFVTGQNAKKHPDIILRQISEGHEIGNHTYSHPSLANIRDERLSKEILSTEDVLFEIAEYRPKLFRPPQGDTSETIDRTSEKLDYKVIVWSIDTVDWAHTAKDKIVKQVVDKTVSGDIILFHDFIAGNSQTPDALREIIPSLLAKGFEFVTVSELVNTTE